MGHQSRRACCAVLFWIKVTIAILIACGVMAFFSLRIYTKHDDAMNKLNKPAAPLNVPIPDGTVAPDSQPATSSPAIQNIPAPVPTPTVAPADPAAPAAADPAATATTDPAAPVVPDAAAVAARAMGLNFDLSRYARAF
ncbi:hypothetical protein HKX48_006524 [Thoreauomyces humboldtii]|nr:hypothetical protein HKX48_006524 [Thoreauomyces humboldtii]